MLEYMLKIEKDGGESSFVTSFPSILDASVTEIEPGSLPDFIRIIQKRFNINGLDINKAKIEEIKKDKIFMITSNEKVLFLKLDEKKSKAILYEQNSNKKETIFNFDLEKFLDCSIITEFMPKTIEQAVFSYQNAIETAMERIHMPALIHRLVQDYSLAHSSRSFTNEYQQNYILLANNYKFMSHLEKIKQDFDSQYILFKSMNNSILLNLTKNN
jgi:hypothetical protein